MLPIGSGRPNGRESVPSFTTVDTHETTGADEAPSWSPWHSSHYSSLPTSKPNAYTCFGESSSTGMHRQQQMEELNPLSEYQTEYRPFQDIPYATTSQSGFSRYASTPYESIPEYVPRYDYHVVGQQRCGDPSGLPPETGQPAMGAMPVQEPCSPYSMGAQHYQQQQVPQPAQERDQTVLSQQSLNSPVMPLHSFTDFVLLDVPLTQRCRQLLFRLAQRPQIKLNYNDYFEYWHIYGLLRVNVPDRRLSLYVYLQTITIRFAIGCRLTYKRVYFKDLKHNISLAFPPIDERTPPGLTPEEVASVASMKVAMENMHPKHRFQWFVRNSLTHEPQSPSDLSIQRDECIADARNLAAHDSTAVDHTNHTSINRLCAAFGITGAGCQDSQRRGRSGDNSSRSQHRTDVRHIGLQLHLHNYRGRRARYFNSRLSHQCLALPLTAILN